MNVSAKKLIYFSPTETTKKIVAAIAQGVGEMSEAVINLTFPDSNTREFDVLADELAIIGMPVYAGRLPPEAVDRFRRVRGNNTPAIIVVAYGNRAYDDALIELRDVAMAAGFVPIAAGAFIGEHSFSNENALIAQHRPDANDLSCAIEFGKAVRTKIEGMASLAGLPLLAVPGNFPYMDFRMLKGVAPISDETLCTRCGNCTYLCPTGAISLQDQTLLTDVSKCILCCACVKLCNAGARKLVDERIDKLRGMLVSKFSQRKEPEIFS